MPPPPWEYECPVGIFIAPCWRCGTWQPRFYGENLDQCCVDCYVEIKRKLVVDRIDFGREVAHSFRQDLVLLMTPHTMWRQLTSQSRRRLHFLHVALVVPFGSPFRRLGHLGSIGNISAGYISRAEDILKRVLSFLLRS